MGAGILLRCARVERDATSEYATAAVPPHNDNLSKLKSEQDTYEQLSMSFEPSDR